MKTMLAAALVIAPALAGAAAAQQGGNEQDRHFATQAAASGEQEVAAGRLAETEAATPAVREFGRWMVTDHTLLGKLLQSRAHEAGIELPAAPTTRLNSDQLSGLHGQKFDDAYMTQQVKAHQQAVALFEQEASAGQSPALKGAAQLALPVLQQHLAEARELQTVALAKAPGGTQVSLPSSAPPATTTRNTASSAQGPMVKQLNQQGAARIEKEGK